MSPQEQAAGCLRADAELVEAYEALDESSRDDLRITLAFLPAPIDVQTMAAMRLNETSLHGWDVAVADDPDATVPAAAVPVMLDALSGPLSFLLGFIGKGGLAQGALAVHTTDPDHHLGLHLGESVSLTPTAPDDPDGSLTLPGEAFLRLLSGRLGPSHTPALTVTGTADLDTLRGVFPGF